MTRDLNTQEWVDAVWWRTSGGRRWHRFDFPADGSEPYYTVCGISKFKLVEGTAIRPSERYRCHRCLP